MELRELRTFLAVAELLSFNRAAEVLHYAPSTVSTQIRALEEELGTPLFDRLGKGVNLTQAGQRLVRYARKMLDIEREAEAEVTGREQIQGSLTLRMPQSLTTFYLPEIVDRFQSAYPKVGLCVSNCAYHSLVQEMGGGIVDLAFLLADSVVLPGLEVELLGTEPLAMVCRPGHPLTEKANLDIRDLEGQTILFPEHDCSYKMIFEQMLLEAKVQAGATLVLNSLEALKSMAALGVGVAMAPLMALREELAQGRLVVLPWPEEPLSTGVLMIRHGGRWLSPPLLALMDLCRRGMGGN